MKLARIILTDERQREEWEKQGFLLPKFSIEKVEGDTKKSPVWLHFGAGNIFRAFPAVALQKLLDKGLADKGIIVCETFDEEIIEKSFTPYDNLTTVVTLKASDDVDKRIVASIVETLTLSANKDRIAEIFCEQSLQMCSLTITEKGYATNDVSGNVLPYIKSDAENEPQNAKSLPGLLTYLCLKRFEAGAFPLAMVSMDNCANNGDKLKDALCFMASQWKKLGYVTQGFQDYLTSPKISFPISMIDKITPRPGEAIAEMLQKSGYEDVEISCTSKNTFVASFVNAEEAEYLVIEDVFPNGRMPLEKAGIIFTNRETVGSIEKMKVGACLNPLHTMLAIFGCLMGQTYISDEMKNPALVNLIKTAGQIEMLPFVPNPGIIEPKEFLDEVITKRFPNPFIPDTPQRIACDTSQKIPVRFGEVLKSMHEAGKDLKELKAIPFFIAGWLRYLTQLDDNGDKLELSPDPMLPALTPLFSNIKLGYEGPLEKEILDLLTNTAIFGVDLCEVGLSDKIERHFLEMISGKSAVSDTLNKYFGGE